MHAKGRASLTAQQCPIDNVIQTRMHTYKRNIDTCTHIRVRRTRTHTNTNLITCIPRSHTLYIHTHTNSTQGLRNMKTYTLPYCRTFATSMLLNYSPLLYIPSFYLNCITIHHGIGGRAANIAKYVKPHLCTSICARIRMTFACTKV